MTYSEDDRRRWQRLANDASTDPSSAPEVARLLARELGNAVAGQSSRFPIGYTYSGTYKWIARVRDLLPETLPDDTPGEAVAGVALTNTGNDAIQIKVPFDCVVQGVQGWALPKMSLDPETGENFGWPFLLSCAADFRDLFSVRWGLNGDIWYSTDGNDQLTLPASVTVGSQNLPRPMFWPIERDQNINVEFRNIINYFLPFNFGPAQGIELAEAVIVFDVLRLDPA